MAIELSDVMAARKVLQPLLPITPLLLNPWLSERFGCNVYLKLENMQPVGSFKIRGSTYKIATLSEADRKKGVIAASAGNHAQGVAWGARRFGVRSTIVMPERAPMIKVQNTRALGAEVVLAGSTYDEAYQQANALSKKHGFTLLHAFRDKEIISGQGTVALEILDQLPAVDFVVASMGGGGLITGIGSVMKSMNPKVKIVGCQASGCAPLVRMIRTHVREKWLSPSTFADGIAVGDPGEFMMDHVQSVVHQVVDCDEESISAAVVTLMETAKIIVEGSGAIPLAALPALATQIRDKNIVLVLSGGNIDTNLLGRLIDHGLIVSGRRVRANVFISDTPGTLHQLTGVLAELGANVLQVIHDRDDLRVGLKETKVDLTIETRDRQHALECVTKLRAQFLRVDVLGTNL